MGTKRNKMRYAPTVNLRILRKPITRLVKVYPDGTECHEVIGHEDVLQQEFANYEDYFTEWRDVPIVHESEANKSN